MSNLTRLKFGVNHNKTMIFMLVKMDQVNYLCNSDLDFTINVVVMILT
jgi:hypothetical protein